MKFSLIIPTLNEVIGMEEIMPQIDKSLFEQILVIDGGSTDGTIEYCKKNNIEYFVQQKNGMRHGYNESVPLIRGDVLITFSPDGNSDVQRLKPLVEEMKSTNSDMIIVSRYKDWAKSEDDDFITSFGNWLFTKTVNLFFKSNYTDVMVIYRAFKKDMIHELELMDNKHYSFVEKAFFTKISWEPLLSARAARMKYKISEIPGDEPPRIGGDRKLQVIKWGAAYYSQFIIELCRSLFLKNRI